MSGEKQLKVVIPSYVAFIFSAHVNKIVALSKKSSEKDIPFDREKNVLIWIITGSVEELWNNSPKVPPKSRVLYFSTVIRDLLLIRLLT